MRSTDERLTIIKQRTEELENEKRIRNGKILGLSSFVASLVMILGAALAMPGIMGTLVQNKYTGTGGLGSIFSSGSYVGYVFIGLFAFLLGVCVTFLCMQLQRRNKEDQHHGRDC